MPSIIEASGVDPNPAGDRDSAFGSAEFSYARRRNGVPLFDYRTVTDSELQLALDACSPFDARLRCQNELTILFLAPHAYELLETWEQAKRGLIGGEMLVPYVEAIYPGRLPLQAIEERLDLHIEHTPSAFEQALNSTHA